MDEQSVPRINGWVRLWIALAVIGLIPAPLQATANSIEPQTPS